MEAVNVTIRMDKGDRDRANQLFKELGMTFNSAVNMFVKQSLREQAIPFKATTNMIVVASNEEVQATSRKVLKANLKAYKELAK